MKIKGKKIAVFDTETDPFLYDRKPEPFACGFYNGETYQEFWGDDCINEFLAFLDTLDEPHIIYAHNGGKFDFFFLLYHGVIENPVKIINGRIVKAKIGKHEIRDSFAILPVPLAVYQKDEIDYNWFEREHREQYKDKILKYLYGDCVYLYDLVCKFIERFGLKLTIGGTAINILKEMHPFEHTQKTHDERLRPFYFGGRVQHFEQGIIKGDFKVIDVNSMYPYVMANYQHPHGEDNYMSYYTHDNCAKLINKKGKAKNNNPYFISFTGTNKGALPMRTDNGLNFNIEHGTFFTTHHELQVALKYNLVTIETIHELHLFDKKMNFKKFVNKYIKEKIIAKKTKDKAAEIFAKLLLNSSYGKTAQRGDAFKDYYIYYDETNTERPDLDEWELYIDMNEIEIYTRPSPKPLFYDVAIGASITGAARAYLLEALCNVERPLYCDTDSIICEGHGNLQLDPYELGQWDIEATGDKLALVGKKLYALFDGKVCMKLASKGAKLSGKDLVKMANGQEVHWQSDAPNFKLTGDTKFTQRTIKMRQ